MHEISHPGRAASADDPPSVESLQAELAAERARTREVDHRAKNTLQLVSSLLLLASRRDAGPETRRTLEAMHRRVCALAAVHRDLLAAPSPDRFDLTQLVRDQATALARSVREGASVQLELDAVEIDTAAACPLALILNELLVNALAHASRDGRIPQVAVRLQRGAGEAFTLAVTDDGPGPAAAAPAGFGLTLVQLLSRQIAAKFMLEDAQPGLRAIVLKA